LLSLLPAACVAPVAEKQAGPPDETANTAVEIPAGSGVIENFLVCELEDGTQYRVFPTPAGMPWRVAIGRPRTSPKFGSIQDARESAIDAMRLWEGAIQTRLPWFELEFVEKDRDAPVQIKWKRRTSGTAQGRAGPTCRQRDGRMWAGGRMEIAVRACPTCDTLTVDEIRMLVAHEFGHILGLGHCLDCDSAMNYSWQTEDRVFVTQVDVEAVVRRADGRQKGEVERLKRLGP